MSPVRPLPDNHRDLLERFRKSMNLVGPGPIEEHFADADGALEALGAVRGRWVDLGTGAGFPGLPFASRFPDVELDLVDSRQKRCVFLQEVLGSSDLRGHASRRVLCQRVEDLEAHAYDGVLSRAFAPPPDVLDHADRLLRGAGLVVLLLQDDAPIPADPRFRVARDHRYFVPNRGPRRAVVLERR